MILSRAYKSNDLQQMCRLALKSDWSVFHPGDLQFKLSDPSINTKESIRIWEDDGGSEIIGFAFMHLTTSELLFETNPSYVNRIELESQIIQWALDQFKKAAANDRGKFSNFYTNVPEFAVERISLLENFGFSRNENTRLYLNYPLDTNLLPAPDFPPGFTVRSLKNAGEVPAYLAAHYNSFLFDKLNEKWRQNVLRMPFYNRQLDLIAVNPDKEIAAFCFCWLEEEKTDNFDAVEKRCGYIHTVGTQYKFQNLGIGKAIFLTALHRLKNLGAEIAVGDTAADNMFALRLYEAVGVRRRHKIYCYDWNSLL